MKHSITQFIRASFLLTLIGAGSGVAFSHGFYVVGFVLLFGAWAAGNWEACQ